MESFVEDLKRQVQCSLCNEMMIEPKLLQCFHTFCKLCIKRHAQLDEQVNIFKCPRCTSQTLLEELDDVEDLQISPVHSRILQVLSFVENQKVCSVSASHCEALWKCIHCDNSLCDDCLGYHSKFAKNHKVVSISDMKKEDIEAMLKRESPCKTHTDQDVELYCLDCNDLICLLCLKDHHHNSHKITSLQEFLATEKDCLSKNLEVIEKMNANKKEKQQQKEIAVNLERDGEKLKKEVKKVTKNLVKALIDHEQKLLNEIQKTITKAKTNLRIIRHTLAAQEYIKYFIQNGTASEMVEIRDSECLKKFTYDPFVKDIGGIEFKPNEELCQQVNTGLGNTRIFKTADLKMSSLKVESDLQAMKKAKLTVVLKTSTGEVMDESLDDVVIHISPEDDVKVGKKQVTTDKHIEVTFTPCVPGQLTAEVQVHGNPVSNSPLVMDVKPQHIEESCTHSKLKDALNTRSNNLVGIAVNKTNSKIAVTDCDTHCIAVFSIEGDLLLTYGSKGSGQEQFEFPYGLAFLNETDLVIADSNNNRICILNTATGKMVKTFGRQGNGNGQFNDPTGVHVDDDSNIIVCDFHNHRVQVLTKDGDYLYQFSVPNAHLCDVVKHNGLFYVSDRRNAVVYVMEIRDNQSPTTVATIGGKDYTDGQLNDPFGLAIDNDNNLLVCENISKLIYKFTLDGRYVGKTSQLNHTPMYIAVLNDGQAICALFRGGALVF